jgi:hypothetical protein
MNKGHDGQDKKISLERNDINKEELCPQLLSN